jgi:hypothetical protein
MIGSAFPLLLLPLPGAWVQVPLSDEVRVNRVVELLEESGADLDAVEGLRLQLLELAAAGGDQLFLQEGARDSTAVITAWPPSVAEQPTVDGLRALLGALGADAVELPHQDGYVLLRSATTGRCSYWVMHPVTGRVLSLTVLTYGETVTGRPPRVYDQLVGALAWEDASPSGARA